MEWAKLAMMEITQTYDDIVPIDDNMIYFMIHKFVAISAIAIHFISPLLWSRNFIQTLNFKCFGGCSKFNTRYFFGHFLRLLTQMT